MPLRAAAPAIVYDPPSMRRWILANGDVLVSCGDRLIRLTVLRRSRPRDCIRRVHGLVEQRSRSKADRQDPPQGQSSPEKGGRCRVLVHKGDAVKAGMVWCASTIRSSGPRPPTRSGPWTRRQQGLEACLTLELTRKT